MTLKLSKLVFIAGLFLFSLISFNSRAQTTYTSTGSGNFRDNIWSPVVPDFDNVTSDIFIINDGDAIVLASDVSISDLEIGQGGAGATFTMGNDASGRSLTISGNLTNLINSSFNVSNNGATHTVNLAGDLVNAGAAFNLITGSEVANFVFDNSATSVISGTAITFNDLTRSGGGGLIITSGITVAGNFVATGLGTDISSSENMSFQGNFNVVSSASFEATNSTVFFNGASAQTLDWTDGTATFNSLIFDNSVKTIEGNLSSDGTIEITDDAVINSTGRDHNIANLEVKNSLGVGFSDGTVTFIGGELRFGDDTNTDGSFTLGSNVNIIFDGNVFLERDDHITVDGDCEITSDGFLVINGTDMTVPAGERDTELLVTGSRNLTIRDNGDLFIRGYDNFPTGFETYTFEILSLLRYDADFDQIIAGENSLNVPIEIGRLFLSQPDNSPTRVKTLSSGDNVLNINGRFDLINGITFQFNHVATITFGESLFMDPGATAGDPTFNTPLATVIMDADINQTVDGPVQGNYEVDQWFITNTATPTSSRNINIDDNIAVSSVFSVLNPNGSLASDLNIDLDDNQIFGDVGSSESFILGDFTSIFTSTDDPSGFAEGFGDSSPADFIDISENSIVRFDRNGNQTIPAFNGGSFGNIEFSGSGNKYVTNNLDINGDVTRVGGTPIFRFGTLFINPPGIEVSFSAEHTVAGDWNMATVYTGDNESNNGAVEPSITFDGADQLISSSDFNNVIFSGTGTKTLTGTLLIDGDLVINDAVLLNAGSEAIDIAGDWTENGTGNFIQTGSITDFNGGSNQTIIANVNSHFNDLDITNSSTVTIGSNIQIGRDLDIQNGSTMNMDGQTLRIARDLIVNFSGTFNYSDVNTSIIIFDGNTEQDIRNVNAAQNFPTLQFEGVGIKEIVNNIMRIEGDVFISNEATFQGNNFEIDFSGNNWVNSGNFNHTNSVNFLNAGGSSTVSTSTFHDIEIGRSDGSVTTSVTLGGNISLNGEMNIFSGGTLDVSTNNFAITVEEDWNNYGIFRAQQGRVVFSGGRSDLRTLSPTLANSGVQMDKAFYDLTININNEFFIVQENFVILNDQVDILNDLNIISGDFRLQEDLVTNTPTVNIGGGFTIQDGAVSFRQENAKFLMNGTSGTHDIDLGGDVVRDFEINALGATYQLINDFSTRDDSDNEFTLTAGTLDLNGNILTINRGGFDMTGGTLIVDEGASLLLNDLAVNPDFNKTGGELRITGLDGEPATLSSVDNGGFTFIQTGGDLQAQFYTIAGTSGDGLRIEGGTIDVANATGNNFSNGTFTSGIGNAYLTLAGIDLNSANGDISASNVVFNAGPTFNVAVDAGDLPSGGTIEFIVAGGALAGEQDEDDVPDGGATDGFIRWDEDPGFQWTGAGGDSDWNNSANWAIDSGVIDDGGDGIPDTDDLIYLAGGAAPYPIITTTETAARLTVRSGGSFEISTGEFNVNGNLTLFSGADLTMSDPSGLLNVSGAWSNAGVFNEGTATVTFNGTEGTHSIGTLGNSDPFYNLVIEGDGATYTVGSVLTVSNSFTLSNGILDASSGFDIFINQDWLVNGGILKPGQGRILFNGSAGTQSISGGTMFDVQFEGGATKSIDGNISIADDVNFVAGTGDVLGNSQTIFIGGDWDLDETDAFVPGSGTVIFNGSSTQNFEADDTHVLSFNNVIFQNVGIKNFFFDANVAGNFSIIANNTFVDLEAGSTVVITGDLSQTGGQLRIFDSNFPVAGSYSFGAGEVVFLQNGTITIPGGITFHDLQIRALNNVATRATLMGDIVVNDDINLSAGTVTFDINGNSISLQDGFFLRSSDELIWGGGTLIHLGAFWSMDADFNMTNRAFENLILRGTSFKRPNSDIGVNGNLIVGEGVGLQQLTRMIVNDGDDSFIMEADAILDTRIVGVAIPTGFANYSLNETSTVDLRGTGNQTIFTNGGTLNYGVLRLFTIGNATLDGNLSVVGNFDMNSNATLIDGGFDMEFKGSFTQIQDYTPTIGSTTTFSRSGDQSIVDNDGSGMNLDFQNLIFGGSGIKTFFPNAGDEVTNIDGDFIIEPGVTATTSRGVTFSGANWVNNGTFNLTVNSRPFVFDGGNSTVNPGANEIASLIVSNTSGTTVTIEDNGFDLGTGDFTLSANATINFGSLTHNMANINYVLDPTSNWILEDGLGLGATLIFDRNSTQFLPIINESLGNITGAPSIEISNAGTKALQGDIVVDNVVIGVNTNLDVDNTNSFQITANGSWTNNGGNFFERDGTVVFNSDDTDPETIEPGGENFREVIFQGSAVSVYTLQSDLFVLGNTAGDGLQLASATLDLNGNTLTLGNNDIGDPNAEINTIGNAGTLLVNAGATLQFETSDDGGDVANTEIGGNLDVQNGGRLSVVGSNSALAMITRSAGNEQIDINIESGGEIEAEFYNIQYMTDEGLEVENGAIIDPDGLGHNFSNGTWSNLSTDAGNGGGGDDNPVDGNTYLSIESDDAMTIDNVTFNFNGTPTVGQHFNVVRSNAAGNNTIDLTNTSGPLGRNGSVYENDGDPTAPADANGQLTWDLPVDTQWIGSVSNDWSDASNWDNGVPSIASNNREAIIGEGMPFNPRINAISVNISGLIISDGILRLENGGTLDLDGDITLGDGTGGAFLMDNTSTLSVSGSWTSSVNVIFDNGDGTVIFDNGAGGSVSISSGDQNFSNLRFTNPTVAGDFNLIGNSLVIEGDLTIENSAKLIPSTPGYNFSVMGDIVSTSGEFDTTVDGVITLSGDNQTITDMIFDELVVAGTGIKNTTGNVEINDVFEIEEGVTLQGGGTIVWNNDVFIAGTFDGVAGQNYIFKGDDWQAEANSYTGEGTVEFNRPNGTQHIRQIDNGDNPVKFHNLTLSGNALIQLGRLIAGSDDDGNVDITGDFTINNTINTFNSFEYLVDNTSGTGTFTLAENEFVIITGANNFPSNFANYVIADNSTVRYWGTIDQTIRGNIEYGNIDLLNSTTKTLGGNVDIDGQLFFRNSILDVSTNNYSINLAGRWETNNGNDDGEFIARDGTVTFDGDDNQVINLGESGSQSFNDVLVNKSAGILDVAISNITINGNLNVFNGTFDINSLTASIGGNVNATGTGSLASFGNGVYLLNATTGTPTIGTNNSVIGGSVVINAPGRNYELIDDLTLLTNLVITAGTLDVNGQILSVGDFQDAIDIFGTLNVSTTDKPGGTLALGNDVQLVVQGGGTINIIGTQSQVARVTSTGITDYIFSVAGAPGNEATIGAKFYVIEYVGTNGIFVNQNGTIDLTANFSDGTFQNGFNGGRYLRIENSQNLIGSNRLENIVFDDNPGGGAANVVKLTNTAGDIELFNYTGSFSGSDFEEDPNDLILWIDPPTVTWTGRISSDWFTDGNWDSGSVPLISQNVLIPQTLNQPILVDDVNVAVANNLTIGVNAIIEINTADTDVDLQIAGDILFDVSASLISLGADDDIEIGGSWLNISGAFFTPGTSQVTFNSPVGVESIENSNGFYNLVVDVAGSAAIADDLNVVNDFTILNGVFDLFTSDLTVRGNFVNNGVIEPRVQTISLIPNDAISPKSFVPGLSELYSLVIGENLGNSVEYDLTGDLIVNHDFTLINNTFDPNGNEVSLGNNDGLLDDVNIGGSITLIANETFAFGGDVSVFVNDGGEFRLLGSDLSNVATITRRSIGSYDFTIQAGGIFEGNNFLIDYIADEGVWFQASSTLDGLANGTFGNGIDATQYLRLSNAFAADITSPDIVFNPGPTFNVRRNEAAGNNIIFQDASGALSGADFELDDGSASTGEVRFIFTNPLRIWNGSALNNRFDDPNNWENDLGVSPASAPTIANTVQIPDVSGGSASFPIINNTSGDQNVDNITIFPGASLTIDDNRSLTVSTDIVNEGTFTISGASNINMGGSWTNNGMFNPGNSTVSMTSASDVTMTGGLSFYNLILDADGTGLGIQWTSSGMLSVLNDFMILDGVYEVADATHTIEIGGDFVIDDTNGAFNDMISLVTFNGDNQTIGSALEAAMITFNDVTIGGAGVKTLSDQVDINGDLNIESTATLSLGGETILFSGSNLDIDGVIDVSGGSSTIAFDGAQVQVITGNVGAVELDNVRINNSAAGNNDIQLNVDLSVNDNSDFMLGVVQSSGSNPMTFNDGATVSYDGNEESLPLTLPGQNVDGNSYVVGPVVKIGDDDFIFPVGEGSRIGQIAITNINSASVSDRYFAEYSFSPSASVGQPLNGGIQHVSLIESWELDRTVGTGEPQVTLFFDANSDVTDFTSLTVAHFTGGNWENEGNGGNTGIPTDGTITSANNFISFSPITLASTDNEENPLPVELLIFEGEAVQEGIELNWTTASEIDNEKFEIERSIDGVNFELIGEVAGNGTTGLLNNYVFIDNNPRLGFNYYRLRQVDFSGIFEFSDVIVVDNTNREIEFQASIYPNPTEPTNINLELKTGNEINPIFINIYDNAGRIYFNSHYMPEQLTSSMQLTIDKSMPSGLYYVEVRQGNEIDRHKLIIK